MVAAKALPLYQDEARKRQQQSGMARNNRRPFAGDQRRLRRVGMATRLAWGVGRTPQHLEPFLVAQ